jgi:type II secretory pathway component PulJ
MITSHKGFFLMEFLVYLSIFSCISILLMHFVVHTTLYVKTQNSELQHSLTFLTALDLATHELEKSGCEKKLWHKTDKDCVIWHSLAQKKDIGLSLIDKKLVRITGTYLPRENRWKSKTTNVIADSIKDFSLEYQWENDPEEHLVLIHCSITGIVDKKKDYTVFKSITMHNRYLL